VTDQEQMVELRELDRLFVEANSVNTPEAWATYRARFQKFRGKAISDFWKISDSPIQFKKWSLSKLLSFNPGGASIRTLEDWRLALVQTEESFQLSLEEISAKVVEITSLISDRRFNGNGTH
jgi:hypothetical protein